MIYDPNPNHVSACPVHFIWDGRGKGRIFVRMGFMGFILTAMAAVLGFGLRMAVAQDIAMGIGIAAVSLWGLGQLLTWLTPLPKHHV